MAEEKSEKKLSTKEEARQAIVAGGSYLLRVGGENILFTQDNIDKFPSDADLAVGNPEAEKLALGDIEAEIERLEAAKKKLTAAKKAEASEAKKSEADAPKADEKKEDKK